MPKTQRLPFCQWTGQAHPKGQPCDCRRFTERQFLALVSIHYDSPADCPCPKDPPRPACMIGLRPCADRSATGTCDCPHVVPACACILAKDPDNDVWLCVVEAFPEIYNPSLAIPEPQIAIRKEERVAMYSLRFQAKHHLFHPDDVVKIPEGVNVTSETLKNGHISISQMTSRITYEELQ